MRNVSSVPWWGWAFIAFFVLNVVLQMDLGIFIPLLIGMVAAGAIGAGRRKGGASQQPLPPQHPLPPARPTDTSGPGWSGGTAAGPASGSSPWVRGSSGQQPPAGTGPSGDGQPGQMPRIEVPRYPDSATPPAAYPSSGASPSTDPVVSLGQLHLSRGARDLHAAATSGSAADVARLLAEVGDQAERLLAQLGGAGAVPGSGRREFETGLRRLQRDVAAARGEDPPGAKVARVVQAAGGMGQTGRYE